MYGLSGHDGLYKTIALMTVTIHDVVLDKPPKSFFYLVCTPLLKYFPGFLFSIFCYESCQGNASQLSTIHQQRDLKDVLKVGSEHV